MFHPDVFHRVFLYQVCQLYISIKVFTAVVSSFIAMKILHSLNQKILLCVTYTNLGFCLPSLKSAWDLVYPGQNRDVREILRDLIGCS